MHPKETVFILNFNSKNNIISIGLNDNTIGLIKDIISNKITKTEQAKAVGKLIAEKAASAGITNVTFDRSGYLYHGRIKSLAEGAREAGLNF